MGVSENSGTPKSSILIGCSIINHPFWGTSIFGNTHIKSRNLNTTQQQNQQSTTNRRQNRWWQWQRELTCYFVSCMRNSYFDLHKSKNLMVCLCHSTLPALKQLSLQSLQWFDKTLRYFYITHGVHVISPEAHDSITFPNRHVLFIAYLSRQNSHLNVEDGVASSDSPPKKSHQPPKWASNADEHPEENEGENACVFLGGWTSGITFLNGMKGYERMYGLQNGWVVKAGNPSNATSTLLRLHIV